MTPEDQGSPAAAASGSVGTHTSLDPGLRNGVAPWLGFSGPFRFILSPAPRGVGVEVGVGKGQVSDGFPRNSISMTFLRSRTSCMSILPTPNRGLRSTWDRTPTGVLVPARDWECSQANAACPADSVLFWLPGFPYRSQGQSQLCLQSIAGSF